MLFFQTLNLQTENGKKNLTFVPLAPACVVSNDMGNQCCYVLIFSKFSIFPTLKTTYAIPEELDHFQVELLTSS